jgi:hypothetical protein
LNSNGIQSENHLGGDDLWVDEWNENWDNESYSFVRGVEYKMTKEGLEKIKADDDVETYSDNDFDQDNDIDDLEQKLQKLKEDRENVEQDLEKTRAQKIQELEKIDRALEEKKAEKNGVKHNKLQFRRHQV